MCVTKTFRRQHYLVVKSGALQSEACRFMCLHHYLRWLIKYLSGAQLLSIEARTIMRLPNSAVLKLKYANECQPLKQ